MMRNLIIALLLVSCAKTDDRIPTSIEVKCRRCVVDYSFGKETVRDSIIGNINYATGDTVPATGKWNAFVPDGTTITVHACYMGIDSLPIVASITCNNRMTKVASNYSDCADIAVDAH